ncbi:NrdH-redoxin [Candidatus Gracilibacteria bacterium]|nr:NrdH-redoxin [Candidatus Gracilibacteria bacterium]
MNAENVVIYGAMWCGDCRRSKKFLDERKVAYTWIDVDKEPDAMAVVEQANGGMRSIPTLVFPDGSILVEPSNAQLAQKLGLSV